MPDCKFISCFSYKGGAGRSTLAINVVPFLVEKLGATADNPLVLVDMDVDSCGLTYLFDLHKEERISNDSVQNWFDPSSFHIPSEDDEDVESAREHNMFKKLFPVGSFFNLEPEVVLCLPANPGEKFSGGGSNYDYEQSVNLTKFKRMAKDIAVGVLFDSAVGDQLPAIWSNHYSNYIMCCMRPTKQFREGTNRFFDLFDEKVISKKIIVIPNVVPTEQLTIVDDNGSVNQYPQYAKERIIEDFRDNLVRSKNEYILDLLAGDKFGVPKIDRFMWQEGVLKNARNLTQLEHTALKRYEEIAEIIATR